MSCCPGFNCFGRPRSSSGMFGLPAREEAGRRNDSEIALQDMAMRPSVIDYDLETAVSRWELAINDYREYEADVFSAKDETLTKF